MLLKVNPNHPSRQSYPSLSLLSNRHVQVGMCIGGSIVAGYIIYNNYDCLINFGKVLFERAVKTSIEAFQEVLTACIAFYIQLEQCIQSISLKLIEILGFAQIGHTIAQLSFKRGRAKLMLGELLLTTLSSLAPIYILSKLKKLVLLIWKIGIRNDAFPLWEFLWQCPSSLGVSKLSRETLSTIVLSGPWERFQILKKIHTFNGLPLENQLSLANYPDFKNLAKIVSGCPGFEDIMLKYCAQYPEIYFGADSLSFTMLLQIGNIMECEAILECLCVNSFLWKGDQKLTGEEICKLIFNRTREEICFLKEWLSLFPNSNSNVKKILNFAKDDFIESVSRFIHIKIEEILKANLHKVEDGENTYPLINSKKFLHDSDIKEWNTLPLRSKEVSERRWSDIKERRLDYILSRICPKAVGDLKETLKKFCNNCLITKDAINNPIKIKEMKRRIEVIWQYIENSIKYMDRYSDTNSLKRIQIILGVLIEGGINCPDLTVASLINAENLIKMFSQGEQYIMNVIVNMFKLHCIESTLLDQNDDENVEAYLYYLLEFNKILELGLSFTTMLHPHKAKKEPLGQALLKIIEKFTAEHLVSYTARLKEFRLVFEMSDIELKKQLQSINRLMDEVYGLNFETVDGIIDRIQKLGIILEQKQMDTLRQNPEEVDPREVIGQLNDRRLQIENNFYLELAKGLHLKSGFLLSQ